MQPVQEARSCVQRHPEQGLDRCHVRYHQHVLAVVFVDDSGLRPTNAFGDAVEALPVGRRDAGVAQPPPVLLRIAIGRLTERQPFPGPEVGFDQVMVDGDVQAERLRRRRRRVVGTLQR